MDIPTIEELIKRTTPKSIDSVCEQVAEVCQQYQFGLLGEINLQEKMQSKGIDFQTPCRIFEVCNPKSAASVLNVEMDIATSLPCRIAIYSDDKTGHTVISTVKPTRLMNIYQAPEAMEEAKHIEDIMQSIVETLAK